MTDPVSSLFTERLIYERGRERLHKLNAITKTHTLFVCLSGCLPLSMSMSSLPQSASHPQHHFRCMGVCVWVGGNKYCYRKFVSWEAFHDSFFAQSKIVNRKTNHPKSSNVCSRRERPQVSIMIASATKKRRDGTGCCAINCSIYCYKCPGKSFTVFRKTRQGKKSNLYTSLYSELQIGTFE